MSASESAPEGTFVPPEDSRPAPTVLHPPTVYVPLDVEDVAMVLPSPNPVLVLVEHSAPHRRLHIPVGLPEGNAIAIARRGIATPRPLTHELFATLLERFNLTLEAVRLTSREGATYLAELIVSSASGLETISCRPTDGIALALRQRLPAPITASLALLEEAGVEGS